MTLLRDPRSDGSYTALQLDSVSSAIVAGPPSVVLNGSSPFTVDAWIRFNGLPAQATALFQQDCFGFGSAANTIFFDWGDGGYVCSDPTLGALDEDTWHHICATWDGGLLRLYIDGVINVSQSMQATAGNTNPILLGQGMQGLVRSVRVFNQCFTAEGVVQNMFADPAALAGGSVAWFDFSQVPPVDVGPSAYAVALKQSATMISVSPALSPGTQGFARPFGDHGINPGGAQTDAYSVQSWIYLDAGTTPRQAVFVNSDLASDTGMALYVTYDAASAGFRLVSQRGSDGDAGQVLTSKALLPVGAWVNVATTFDGQTLSLFVQSQLDSTLACHPIALINTRSNLLVGAAIAQGYPSPTTALQGYIREVDVWSIALTAAQIAQFATALPDPSTPGLAAAYDFTSKPGRNQVNGHPIGLADGATMSGQLGPATTSEAKPPPPPASPHADFVASVRAGLDLAGFASDHGDTLRAAMAADVARYDDEADRSAMESAWTGVIAGLAGTAQPPRFWLTRHRVGDDQLLICHRPTHSEIVCAADAATLDPCTFWKVNLVFAVVLGVLDATFGVSAKLTPAAQAYIARLLTMPALTSRFALASNVTTLSVFQTFRVVHQLGGLIPLVRLIVNVGFWTMLRLLANALLVAVGLGSLRFLASLAITAANLIQLMQDPPPNCAPMPTVTLDAIAFDYGPDSAATSIRRNLLENVAVPEWTPACQAPLDSPAAYANSDIALLGAISIRATFTVNPDQPATIQATDGGILGAIPTFTIQGSGPVTINLPNQEVGGSAVGLSDITWNWTAQVQGGAPSATTTHHRIYTLLAPPTAPWTVAHNVQGQQPWTDVLDHACAWAGAATSAEEALVQITAQTNGSLGLSYDPAGASRYTQGAVDQPSIFQCSMFLELLGGGAGNGSNVNCVDCASIVVTFANILGCDVFATHMTSIGQVQFFACNPIITIGSAAGWSPPFPNGPAPFANGFRYHEVVSTGAALQPHIHDACLKLNMTNDPWTAPPAETPGVLPADIPFTTQAVQPVLPLPVPFTDESYRERLATNAVAGIGSCILLGAWAGTDGGRRPVL